MESIISGFKIAHNAYLMDIGNSSLESFIATEALDLKKTVSNIIQAIVKFYKRLKGNIRKFFQHHFGKGKLINIRGNTILMNIVNGWIRNINSKVKPLTRLKMTKDFYLENESKYNSMLTDASNTFDRMGNEAETLYHTIATEVINSAKMEDYIYTKSDHFEKQSDTIIDILETTSVQLLKMTDDSSKLSENNPGNMAFGMIHGLVNIMAKECNKMLEAFIKSVDKLTYQGSKVNRSYDVEKPFEVEIIADID